MRKYAYLAACSLLYLGTTLCQAGALAERVFGYCTWQSLSGTVSIQYSFDGVTKTPWVGEFYITDDGYAGLRAQDDSWHEIVHNGRIAEKMAGQKGVSGTADTFGPLAAFSRVACITSGARDSYDIEGENGLALTLTAQDMDFSPLIIVTNQAGGLASVQAQAFAGAMMDNFTYGSDQGTNYLTGWRVSRSVQSLGETHQMTVLTQLTNVSVNPNVQDGAWGEP